MDEDADGLDVWRVVPVGIGGTSVIVTDYSKTLRLDNLKSVVVGGLALVQNIRVCHGLR